MLPVPSLDAMEHTRHRAVLSAAACAAGISWGVNPALGGAALLLAITFSALAIALVGMRARLAHRILVALAIVALAGIIATLRGALSEGGPALDASLLVVVNASWMLAMLLAAHALVVVLLRRGEHRRRGWQLADALAAEQAATLRASIAEERAEVAGEIHDGIGHRLAFATLSLGRLSTGPDLDLGMATSLEQIREELADITEELGRTVQLLRRGDAARRPVGHSFDDAVTELEPRGITVRATGLEAAHGATPSASAALARVVEEVGANAAKHASGSALDIQLQRSGPMLELIATTAAPAQLRAASSSGSGLATLARRLELLGGRLEHTTLESEDGSFVVQARVPADAAPRPRGGTSVPDVAAEQDRSRRRARHGLGPAAIAAITLGLVGAATATAVLATHTYLGVLPADQFARLHVGQSRADALAVLPPVQMLEAPVRDAPAAWDCRYYEERASWFERTDVFRVCLDDDAVVELEKIPA